VEERNCEVRQRVKEVEMVRKRWGALKLMQPRRMLTVLQRGKVISDWSSEVVLLFYSQLTNNANLTVISSCLCVINKMGRGQ